MIVHWIVNGVSGSEATGYHSSLATNRYRAILPAQGLRALGHQVRLVDMASWQPQNYTTGEKPDAIVIGKLLGGPRFESLKSQMTEGMQFAQQLGIKVVADINDDHFLHPVLGSHWKAMVSLADAVTAGSDSMAEVVRKYSHRPVFVVSDPVAAPQGEPHVYQSIAGWRRGLIRVLSAMGYAAPRLRLVWYGNPTNWQSMAEWVPRLMTLAKHQPWLLTIVSQPGAGIESFVNGFNAADPANAVIEFEPWSEQGLWPLVQDAHIVLIPADLTDSKKAVKTANRVIDALQSGRFVIAAPVPAYQALAEYVWLGEDPVAGIKWVLANPGEALDKIKRGQAYVQAHHSIEAIARRWAEVLGGQSARELHAGRLPDQAEATQRSTLSSGWRFNLGCGDKILPGYINVDVASSRGGKTPDLLCDLRRLSLADSIASEVLAVHVIEHFWRWDVEAVLREWLRVLAPGGQLIIECPNLVNACKALLDDPVQAAEQDTRGRMTMWVFYGDPAWRDPLMTHKWAYTPESLIRLLENLGYVNVRQEPAQFKMREPRDMRVVGEKPLVSSPVRL